MSTTISPSLNIVRVYVCVCVCSNYVSICASGSLRILSLYYMVCGKFFFRAHPVSTGLWCYTWIYAGGLCLDFWVWSSTSCSRSHMLSVVASDARLSSHFCFFGPFHVVEIIYFLKNITSRAVDVSKLTLMVESAQLESEETGRD